MKRYFVALLSGFAAASIVHAAEPAGVRSPAFNGQDLAGWHVTGCEAGVENGLLVVKDGNGFVRTDGRYRDFVLELDYKPRKAEMYDAGIYIRCELPAEGKPWPSQYQVNLKQGDELNLIKFPKARSTGLIKVGDWNHCKLTVVGDKATMEINGKPAWETDGIEAKQGYIGIQVEVPDGGPVRVQRHLRHRTRRETAIRRPIARRLGRRGRAGREMLESSRWNDRLHRRERPLAAFQRAARRLQPAARIQAQGRRQQRRLYSRAGGRRTTTATARASRSRCSTTRPSVTKLSSPINTLAASMPSCPRRSTSAAKRDSGTHSKSTAAARLPHHSQRRHDRRRR